MKVLHVSSLYPPEVVGGAERVVEMLAEGQAALGCDVAVTYLSRSGKEQGYRNGVKTYPLPSKNLLWVEDVDRQTRVVKAANKLTQNVNVFANSDFCRVLRDYNPDIVHTHSITEFPPLIWQSAKRSGAAVCHTLHEYDLLCSRSSLYRDGENCKARHTSCEVLSSWKSVFHRNIDAVAAVSEPVLQKHIEFGFFQHIEPELRRVIWNGVNIQGERTPRQQAQSDILKIGFLGRLVPEKGIGLLIDACRLLPKDGWQLLVGGRALNGADDFRDRAVGLPVEFCGFVNPKEFLAGINVLVVPSIWEEPFGLTVVEGFAAGVPVIGTDAGAIGELVSKVDPNLVVEANNPNALADKLRSVLENRNVLPRGDFGKELLEAVSPSRMISSYNELYNDLLTGSSV